MKNETTIVLVALLVAGGVAYMVHEQRTTAAQATELARAQATQRSQQALTTSASSVASDLGSLAAGIGGLVRAGTDLYHNIWG